MNRFRIVLWYLFVLTVFVLNLNWLVRASIDEASIGFIALILGMMMLYTHFLLKAFVEYYNEFIADDDEYYYIELNDDENEEKENDEN